jgi:hypothetical protein
MRRWVDEFVEMIPRSSERPECANLRFDHSKSNHPLGWRFVKQADTCNLKNAAILAVDGQTGRYFLVQRISNDKQR